MLLKTKWLNQKKIIKAGKDYQLKKKLLIDELYNATVVKPVEGLGKGTRMFDKLMDRFFNFVGFRQ